MKLLHELSSQLLLGSERRPPPPLEGSGELGAFLQALARQGGDQESMLLRQAGSLAICAAAGYAPASAETPAPPACPTEQARTPDDPQLLATLQQIFIDGPDGLRREALQRLEDCGYCLPPTLLVPALSLGGKNRNLRPALFPVLGQRGGWLATLNPDWSYAIGATAPDIDLEQWEHGSQEQRKQLLESLRRNDPEQARQLLQEGFSQIEARERVSLLDAMRIRLGPADEDFLESLLGDRSKEVRQRAGGLLATLPESRYGQRMAQRMAACIGQECKLFRTVRTLEAPAAFAADWKKDGLEENRAKNESLGERAWWLYQIARHLPLDWWQGSTGLTPAELIGWVRGTDWSEAILRAWHEALLRQPMTDWSSEFITHSGSWGLQIDIFELLALLPAHESERHWLAILNDKLQNHTRGLLLARLLAEFSQRQAAPSPEFADRILAEIRRLANQPPSIGRGVYEICQVLPDFVCLIPPSNFAALSDAWALGPEAEYFSKTLAKVLAIVEQRKTLHQILR
ncbi:MAG: hypothetical protein JNL16_09485 [Dechloromonas sp.]|nr:hypothetical protein [Dechloromonas sp.]